MTPRAIARRATTFARLALASDESLLEEAQLTLAALADVECSFAADRQRVEQTPKQAAEKRRLYAECERRYQQKREPYIRKLEQLECQMKAQLTHCM